MALCYFMAATGCSGASSGQTDEAGNTEEVIRGRVDTSELIHQLQCENDRNALAHVIQSETHTVAEISWSAPTLRESGALLDLYEIDGYLLRFKRADQPWTLTRYIKEEGSGEVGCSVTISPNVDYLIAIASRDIDGLQSDFFELPIRQTKPGV